MAAALLATKTSQSGRRPHAAHVLSSFLTADFRKFWCAYVRWIAFRADPLQQSVIYWSDNGTPSRFHNCAIRDAKNWKCTSKQPFFDVDHEMLDGEFAEYNSSTREPLLRGLGRSSKVPKWKWWATWLVDEISKNN